MDLKGLPYLESHPDSLAHHVNAAEAAGHPAVTLARVERVGAIVDVLKNTKHNGFAVIERGMDGEQHIMGIVLRWQLVVLLKSKRCFQPTSFVSEVGSDSIGLLAPATRGLVLGYGQGSPERLTGSYMPLKQPSNAGFTRAEGNQLAGAVPPAQTLLI